uniref:Uncharacterized protein n=1 Tax=Setaria viridis TaxID=4556 RepID=A0A4U6VXQ0_SETVI|nr:hypothetical protein SEVIR_2G191800v2 [Setaria viridis]
MQLFLSLWCFQRCKLCLFHLNLRLSCERPLYRKNMVQSTNKNTVIYGYRVNFPYRGTLLSLIFYSTVLLPVTQSYVQRGCCSSPFARDISPRFVRYPFCLLCPFMRNCFICIPRCDYSCVQIYAA